LESKCEGVTKFSLDTFIWLLVVPYVLIDAISGFFVQQVGINLRLSQALKIVIFFIFMVYILKYNKGAFFFLTIFLLLFLINPVVMVFTGNSINALSLDFPSLLRINLVIVSTVFFTILAKNRPVSFHNKAKLTFNFSFWVVCINVLSGYFGFGFFSYPNEGFGFKGFFVAGNELSALFILLSSFVLFTSWRIKGFSFRYMTVSLLTIVIGLSIGTKAGAIASLLSPAIIPLIISISKISFSKALFRMTIVFLFLCSSILLFFSVIMDSAMFTRILYIFETKGIMGVIFSDRNLYAYDFFARINDSQGFFPLLFGSGSGIPQYEFKTIEIDFLDVAMYFGFPLALICSIFAFLSILVPLNLINKRPYSPLVLVVNTLLFFLASVAGHVWTSGMLGIAWGILNGLLFIKHPLHREITV
jgi:hypothetical protein